MPLVTLPGAGHTPYSDLHHRMAAYIRDKTGAPPLSHLSRSTIKREDFATFLDLPPELGNRIYELVAPPRNQHITICAEKSPRDVPHPISRTCRLVQEETAPYFLTGEGSTLVFVLRHADDLAACLDWISFVPEYSLAEVRAIRVKLFHSDHDPEWRRFDCCHWGCCVVFELQLHDEAPLTWFGSPRMWEKSCVERETLSQQIQAVARVVEGERAGGRKMTRGCLADVFEALRRGGDERVAREYGERMGAVGLSDQGV